MKPSVGRIVHFHDTEVNGAREDFGQLQGPFAALVLHAGDDVVNLEVFPRDARGSRWVAEDIPFSSEPKAGHWSWPPRG